jgi:hypothetical protein
MSVGRDAPASGAPDDVEQEAAYAAITRRLLLDEARIIGFLSVAGRRAAAPPLRPYLDRLATTLTAFVATDVAIIPSFEAWASPAGSAEPESRPRLTVREIRPRVVEVLPPSCASAADAALALEQVLSTLSEDFRQVLVDLGGYATPLSAPPALSLVEGVVFVVSARAARMGALRRLGRAIPDSKQIGAILVG